MKMLVAALLCLALVVPTSVFPAGTTLEVKGSAKNDGSFVIQTSNITHTLGIQNNPAIEEAGEWITLYANDTEGDPDGDLLSNLEEFLGADEEISLHMDYLVGDRLFEGDWTHPVNTDTDADSLMMAGKFAMNLTQTKVTESLVPILASEKIASVPSPASPLLDRIFDSTALPHAYISLTNEFTTLRQCRQISDHWFSIK